MTQHGIHRTAGPDGAQRSVPSKSAATIPDKLYFRIGDVATLCEVPAYVLRFWESEFPQLKPNKGGTGQRLYRRRDVEMALRIKTLLYDEGFTIPGARQMLKTEQRPKEPQLSLAIVDGDTSPAADRKAMRKLQKEMRELVEMLSTSPVNSLAKGGVQAIRVPRSQRAVPTVAAVSDDLFR